MTKEGWRLIDADAKKGQCVLLFFPNGYWLNDTKFGVGFWGEGDDWFDQEAAGMSMTSFGSAPTHYQSLIGPNGEEAT